jgi:HlyD family secretion protein
METLRATEVTISAEANGKIEYLNLEEGDVLEPKNKVALIATQLYLNKQLIVINQTPVDSKSRNVSQINVSQEQLKTTLIEKIRVQNMFAENAATKRQLIVDGKVNVIRTDKSVRTQYLSQMKPSVKVQIEKLVPD